MTAYAAFHNPTCGIPNAICEGGAGWMYGKPTVQMHVGGWSALIAAMRAGAKRLPPIDPDKAERYWDGAKPGDTVLSNFYEDRFDEYHADQLRIALAPAKARGLTVAHYGLPSFDQRIQYDTFWPIVSDVIDITAPGYYANNDDPEKTWTATDKRRMKVQQLAAETFGKRSGFVVSPQTHQGRAIHKTKFQSQLSLIWADDVFVWCSQSKANTLATFAAVRAVKAVGMQE